MAKKTLPKRLYVKRDSGPNDKDSTWFQADETPDSMDHGETVGIYELVETKRMKVTRDLE
jgi:hypothetical protein